jgi:hypothetical protein
LAIASAPLTLEEKLKWHRAGFARKVPENLLPVWMQAIWLFDMGLPETTVIELPEGTTFCGSNQATIGDLITGFNLEYFTQAFAHEVPASPFDVELTNELAQ